MPDVYNLGAARKVAAKTGKEYVRHALAILIEEVIGRQQTQVGVVVHAATRLVVGEPYRSGNWRERSIPCVSWRNELQQVLRRHGKRAAGYLSSGKYARRRVGAPVHVVRLDLRPGIAKSVGEWLRPCRPLHGARHGTRSR